MTTDTVQACNDKQQIEPMLKQLDTLPEELGPLVNLVADTGYFSAANVTACREQHITPLIAMKREGHHPDPLARFSEPPPLEGGRNGSGKDAPFTPDDGGTGTVCQTQMHDRRQPVIGSLKSVMGFRQFSLRGLKNVKGEWNLVCMAWNLKRMFVLAGSLRAATA